VLSVGPAAVTALPRLAQLVEPRSELGSSDEFVPGLMQA
jgi:hypothetical protein